VPVAEREVVDQVATDLPRRRQPRRHAQRAVLARVLVIRRHHGQLQAAGGQQVAAGALQLFGDAVAQQLALQGGAHARLQQRHVDRLGQVVLRAGLDAAHHALHLVGRGHHQHRQFG
jgi:hypothetical protein